MQTSGTKTKNTDHKKSAQFYLPVGEIKEDTVILKDGTLRSILYVSSINFALKSEDEQNALISSYVGFLNSIDFPLQIVMQSRRLRIKPYLDSLREKRDEMTNELLQAQVDDYSSFVADLVDMGQIMTKSFYVVVPYDPLSNKKKSFWSRTKEIFKPAFSIKLKEERFQERKYNLDLRVRQIQSGLESMSLAVVRMDTQALIELFFSSYNPDISFGQQLADIDKLNVERL